MDVRRLPLQAPRHTTQDLEIQMEAVREEISGDMDLKTQYLFS